MKKNTTLTTVKPPAAVEIPITSNPNPPSPSRLAAETPGPVRRDLLPWPDDSADYREAILRRYDAPFPCFWQHRGLND